MRRHSPPEPPTQAVAERFELFLDEAAALAAAWFGAAAEPDRAALIVQMASAMLLREGSDLLALAIQTHPKTQGLSPQAEKD